jgi:predicted Mrr-cat superfamily restriction endonuclease
LINFVGQIWAFCGRIQSGDLVVLPLKMRSAIVIGNVAGPYQYRPDLPEDAKHTRPVTWLSIDLPRSTFDQDILFSFGALLQADGYTTELSPSGPDSGVDIIAGRGAMGFDPPRLCVQMKSGNDPVDVKVLRELQGVMRNFGTEQSLLVSWGGFKQSVHNEARRLFFEMRL